MKRIFLCRCCCKGADLKKLAPSLEKKLSVTIHYPRMRICFVQHPAKDNTLLFIAAPQNFTDTCSCVKCCLVFPDRNYASRFMFSDDILKVARRLRQTRVKKYLLI